MLIHGNDTSNTSWTKLITDASRAWKQIQYVTILKIILMHKDVKEGFFSSVCCGSNRKFFWRAYASSF